jgi:multidrug resistance efflux pump
MILPHHLQARCSAGRDNEMLKTIFAIALTMFAAGVLAQTSDAPLSLDVAQQRARFAREQMVTAERKAQAAEKKDKAAQKRFEEAKTQAEQAAKELQEAQAEFAKARERHDQAYTDLKRAHDAFQESNKQQ